MVLAVPQFEALMSDDTKRVLEDLEWLEDEDHSHIRYFSAHVSSDAGYPLTVKGSYNAIAGKLSFGLILAGEGSIYRLDLGRDHKGLGETHKHRIRGDGDDVYAPPDITADPHDTLLAWEQFCREAHIKHEGILKRPEPVQRHLM